MSSPFYNYHYSKFLYSINNYIHHLINHLLSQILISLNQHYDGTIYVIYRTTKILAAMNILKEVIVLEYKYKSETK